MSFGKRLRGLRRSQDFSQQHVAEETGINPNQISLYEREQSFPSVPVLMQLADFFEVSTDYLLFEDRGTLKDINVADLDLLNLLEAVDRLNKKERGVIKDLLNAYLVRQQTRDLT